jgi:hypothetical protein
MKYQALLMLAALMPAPAQIATSVSTRNPETSTAPVKRMVIGRGAFDALERRFDGEFDKVGNPDNPIELLGNTRGVYLDGFGVVFTTELSLVATPGPSPFLTGPIPKELITRTHQKKKERLPVLRTSMREMLKVAGLALVQVPENQQIVMVVRLDYRTWENTAGLPGQILMRTGRKSAMVGEIAATEEQ